MNRVRRRRLAEAVLIFKDGEENDEQLLSQNATLLEVQVHLEPLMNQLRLLANICFTQKFINNIIRVRNQEQQ